MDPRWLVVVRMVHITAAVCWVGEVLVINFVLLPSTRRLADEPRRAFMVQVFPRVFALASVLSGTAVASGLTLAWGATRGDLSLLLRGRWGLCILAGATLGSLLTAFHFVLERKVAPVFGDCADPTGLDDVHTKLQILPRGGLVVLLTTMFLMFWAARGW